MFFSSRNTFKLFDTKSEIQLLLWCSQMYCSLLHTINNSLPIQISLEKRGVKYIWSCSNSENYVVKTISQLATTLSRSVLGHNYRYFSYKYLIMSHQWYESYNNNNNNNCLKSNIQ